MNPDNTVEYNSLSWVKNQLDDVLSDAQSSLNEYIENKADEELENCIEHLQLIYGTLQMVEVYGASMLAEEMQATTSALLAGDIDRAEDTYDVLMRAMLQLPDYLEGIQAGKKDAPITLMPLINDLRAARKEGLLTESVLFSPDVESAELASDVYDEESSESGKLQDETRRLRTHYQLGLLDYIRNNKERVGLQRIKAVLGALEKVSHNAEVRRLWMVVGALVEGLMKQGIDTNLSIKMLLGAVDRQLKQIIDSGEDEFARQYSRELIKNVLYYVGMCTVDTKRIAAVKKAYQLSDLIPQEEEDSAAIGGLNANLFDTVSKGITEDLVQVKDVLELFMYSGEQNLEQLVPVVEQLGKIADTYGMLGMGAIRQSIMDQRQVLDGIANGSTEISEQVVLGIASELLKAESELKDYIDSRSGFVDMTHSDTDDEGESAVPAAEYRQVVHTVVSEGLKNFSEAKEAVLAFVTGIGDKEQLQIILNRLEEVRGVSMMLPLGRVETLIEKLQQYIRNALLNNDHQADENEQDTVADVVTSIEYFFEALSEGRPGVEQGLKAGEVAAEELVAITERYDDGAALTEAVETDTETGGVEDTATATKNEQQESTEEVKQTDSVVEKAKTPQVIAQEVTEYAILADDADEEIVEIFIEEAVEVLGELHEFLPQWKDNSDDEEALAVVRRSFHTLKGSGRLLGAEMIGEFSWKFENLLNRVIEGKVNVSEDMTNALDEALAVLPQLIEQLKGNREPVENIALLMNTADALAEGREVPAGVETSIEDIEDDIDLQAVTASDLPEAEDIIAEEVGSEFDDSQQSENNEQMLASSDDDTGIIEIEDIEPEGFEQELDATSEADEFDMELEPPAITEAGTDEAVQDEADEIEIEEISVQAEDIGGVEVLDVGSDTETDIELSIMDNEIDGAEVIETEAEETDSIDVADLAAGAPSIELSEESTVASGDGDNEEVIEISADSVDEDVQDEEFDVVIDEDIVAVSDESFTIDPMLLKIYHDESVGYVEIIRKLIEDSSISGKALIAGKDLIRSFHTLYGSARTAEVEPIADLSGSAEKYVKVRQESSEHEIPENVVAVLKEIEETISKMLQVVSEGRLPEANKPLQDRINKIVQQEIQDQLQKSWLDNSVDTQSIVADDMSVDIMELAPDSNEEIEQAPETDSLEINDTDYTDEVEIGVGVEAGAEAEAELMSYGDIDSELIDIFLEEAEELLESCEDTLNDIRTTPNSAEHIHQLQRNMHTLKGGARMADLTPIGDLTHNLESLVVLVNDKKIVADKILFDLLQESLDTLTNMLANVKRREPLQPAADLNHRIELLMRGEVEEKRSHERYDIDLIDLESGEEEELEDIDISALLPEKQDDDSDKEAKQFNDDASVAEIKKAEIRSNAGDSDKTEERPHWGERASDVNFKDSQEQVRVRSDLLNNLVNYAGEVNIYHARMGKQITDFGFNLAELTQTVVRLKEQLRNLEIETEIQIRSGYEKEADDFDDNFDPLEMDQYSTMQQLTRSLSETAGDVESLNEILNEITRDSETLLVQESRISTDLQEGLMRTRMVRFGGLSSRLRRIVRQVARDLGKEVEVEIIGESSEVDRTVLDRITAPLEHLLRNAVAHGIETPEIRKAKGKNETGKVVIKVDRQSTDVIIDIKDDGAGIDAGKIREKAVKQGFVTEDAKLSDHDALQFILQSGFSTADEVTQVAGRGVGMDVVDSEIKQLGGVLDIDTVKGEGTQFNVRLPLTLAINQALLVSAGEDVFAVPLASIEGVVRMTGHELQRFYDSDNNYYEFNGVEFELKHLGGLLTGVQPDYAKQLQLFPVLLVRVGDQHFALHVDDMLGRREIVVKPVGMQIGAVRGIAGATILADGRVVLILEMSALVMAESLFKPHIPVEVEPVAVQDDKKTIMVVDDSITIRKITERMLKRYGIEVVLAKDGVDATNQLQDSVPDLMLLDIEMPRMDGFEVASYVRNDDRLKEIPIIMITSRTGAKHKEKAMEIGVNEYLGKPFQEEELVKDINKILNTSY